MSIGDFLDRQLLKRVKAGDGKGAELLVRRYQRRAYETAYHVVLKRELAEDVVQDAFLKMISSVDSYDFDRPFWPWFRRIVVNAALNAVRSRNRRRAHEHESASERAAEASASRLDPAEAADFRESVRKALAKLSPELRITFVLRASQELSYREIAETLGVPVGTVMSRLAKARELLKRELRDYENAV